MMENNQMDTEICDPVMEANWELWYQDLFDRECPRKVDSRGQGLVQGLTALWAHHLSETVQVNGQKGFSRFNLWWRQQQLSIEITGDWQGMVRLRGWVFGSRSAASRDHLDDEDRDLLRDVALAHSCLVLAGQSSEPILAAAQNCERREAFQEHITNLIRTTRKEK
jgi:hypothetical protein